MNNQPLPPDDPSRPVRPIRMARRCHCGKCRHCIDDARWERIFTEKFEDPTYYHRNPVKFTSPLASLTGSA